MSLKVTSSTETHTERIFAFPLQQWEHERASCHVVRTLPVFSTVNYTTLVEPSRLLQTQMSKFAIDTSHLSSLRSYAIYLTAS